MSRAKKLDTRYAAPRYVTAVAVVYDTTCCCSCCSLPEHRSGRIRSELRFDALPQSGTFRGWAGHVRAIPLDRERHNGPMNAQAVRARAEIFAELIGVPVRDETDVKVTLRRKN